ncbi:MAG: hypothetical protein R3C49_26075 [Planctomycetaceae bacterium]
MLIGLICSAVAFGQSAVSVSDEDIRTASTLTALNEFTLPEIARYLKLPRGFLAKAEFREAHRPGFLSDDMVPFLIRMLNEDHDDELHVQAADSVARICRERLAPAEAFLPALRKRLSGTSNRNVRRSCVVALLEADSSADADLLAEQCGPGDEVLSLATETKLIEWKSKAQQAAWQARVQADDLGGVALLRTACAGLAAIGDSSFTADLLELTADDRRPYSVRQAAGRSAAVLDSAAAGKLAAEFSDKTQIQQLLAVDLLQHAEQPATLDLLADLCDREDDAVASTAWKTLLQRDVDRLLPKLAAGLTHQDASVRLSAADVVLARPTPERCEQLVSVLGDVHLTVRNRAREVLRLLAETDADLRAHICSVVGNRESDSASGWQYLEQSMLLLGQLHHDLFQVRHAELLKHDRPEVMVTAAWILDVMPREETGSAITAEVQRGWQLLRSKEQPEPVFRLAHQTRLIFLFEAASALGRQGVRDVCAAQFSKAAPLTPEGRAVGLWTLATLSVRSGDRALADRYIERIFDDNPFDPEQMVVKCASALALGLIASDNAVDGLRKAHAQYGVGGELGRCVSTSLKMLGQTVPVEPEFLPSPIGGWPISPVAE